MAEPSSTPLGVVRFGIFELDLQSGELRKAGVRIGLQEQPLQVLTLLLERPGDLVTREQLRQRLWPGGTFVDFDHGLNAVINRLRDTLGDSAETPRFIETLPRRGYRFVGAVNAAKTVEPLARIGVTQPLECGTVSAQRRQGSGGRYGSARRRRGGSVAAPAKTRRGWTAAKGRAPHEACGQRGLAGLRSRWRTGRIRVVRREVRQHRHLRDPGRLDRRRRLTTDPAEDYAPSWSPDGRRIAFLRRVGNEARIHVTSALGGPDLKVSDFPVGAAVVPAIIALQMTWSPDGRYIVAGRDPRSQTSAPAGVYLIPLEGGELRAVTRPKRPTFDFSPVFSPDGRRLAYASCDTPGLGTFRCCYLASVSYVLSTSMAPLLRPLRREQWPRSR